MNFAIVCPKCGTVELTEQQYEQQLVEDGDWTCPNCAARCMWDITAEATPVQETMIDDFLPPTTPVAMSKKMRDIRWTFAADFLKAQLGAEVGDFFTETPELVDRSIELADALIKGLIESERNGQGHKG